MAIGNATITAKTGPAKTVTALSVTNIKSLEIDFPNAVLRIFQVTGGYKEFDIAAVTTTTVSISGANGTFAITIS